MRSHLAALTFSFEKMTELIFACTGKEILKFFFTSTKWNPRRLDSAPDISVHVL